MSEHWLLCMTMRRAGEIVPCMHCIQCIPWGQMKLYHVYKVHTMYTMWAGEIVPCTMYTMYYTKGRWNCTRCTMCTMYTMWADEMYHVYNVYHVYTEGRWNCTIYTKYIRCIKWKYEIVPGIQCITMRAGALWSTLVLPWLHLHCTVQCRKCTTKCTVQNMRFIKCVV